MKRYLFVILFSDRHKVNDDLFYVRTKPATLQSLIFVIIGHINNVMQELVL